MPDIFAAANPTLQSAFALNEELEDRPEHKVLAASLGRPAQINEDSATQKVMNDDESTISINFEIALQVIDVDNGLPVIDNIPGGENRSLVFSEAVSSDMSAYLELLNGMTDGTFCIYPKPDKSVF